MDFMGWRSSAKKFLWCDLWLVFLVYLSKSWCWDNCWLCLCQGCLQCEENKDWILATSRYGDDFISAIRKGNIHALQFHPEKSGGMFYLPIAASVWLVTSQFYSYFPAKCSTNSGILKSYWGQSSRVHVSGFIFVSNLLWSICNHKVPSLTWVEQKFKMRGGTRKIQLWPKWRRKHVRVKWKRSLNSLQECPLLGLGCPYVRSKVWRIKSCMYCMI
jgi:hypothetical protein